MGKLIDTSIFIESERGRLDLEAQLSKGSEEFFMSVITASELLHGVHRATPKYREQRSKTIETWIERSAILDIDLSIARQHADLFAKLKSKGQLIGVHDQWLAATCLANQLTMITTNVREFDRVPGLKVENWASA